MGPIRFLKEVYQRDVNQHDDKNLTGVDE